tara:strand:- start:493 stop:729 length:237 start_codon:yes stop_codon:yes gene_type:complete
MITRAAGGSEERQVPCGQIQIPDLWHLVGWLRRQNMGQRAEEVLEAWHIAHDLQNHILHQPDFTPVEVLARAGTGRKE